MPSSAFDTITAPTAAAAFHGSDTVNGRAAASMAAGSTHTAFCRAAVARKSTPEQNLCWYTPPAATESSESSSNSTTGSIPPTMASRPAQASSTATTPNASAPTRIGVSPSPRKAAASRAVMTGFIEMMTAPRTAGAPCSRARYRQPNSMPCASNPLTSTCTSVRPVGQLTRASIAQPLRIAPATPNRKTSTAMGDMAETARAPIG